MRHYLNITGAFFLIGLVAMGCQKNSSDANQETILKGSTSVMTDETLLPIVEDQVAVFESAYDAKIKLIPKSEAEIVNALVNGDIAVAILSRRLSTEERQIFTNRKIFPQETGFGTDALVFIKNSNSNDTLLDLADIISFLKGNDIPGIKGLVFDNPNSSTVRYLDSVAGITKARKEGIYSFNNNAEVIKYVAENNGFIGVVGLSWLTQPPADLEKFRDQIQILSLRDIDAKVYVSPTQNNIAEGKYPLARDLFIVNCQAYAGLGMGFASFMTGERGQRIVLKSGLLPIRIPGRKINIRSDVEKKEVK